MTKLENMADDYYQDRPQGFGDPREDYMAGFKAAREMAAEVMEKQKVLGEGPYGFVFDGHYVMHELPKVIRKLGEEE